MREQPLLHAFLAAHHLFLSDTDISPAHGRRVISTVNIPAGTAVFGHPALATVSPQFKAVVTDSSVPPLCHWCLHPPATLDALLRCGACKKAQYCGRTCQRRDWGRGGHKILCGRWAKRKTTRNEGVDGESRCGAQQDQREMDLEMLVKVGFALLQRDRQQRVEEEEYDQRLNVEALEGLVSHYEELDRTTKDLVNDIASEAFELLVNSKSMNNNIDDGVASDPLSKERLVQLLAQFRCNNFSIHDDQLFPTGVEGTFPLGSLLNHSCLPNCVVAYERRTQVVRTIRDVTADEELTIGYVDSMLTRQERRRKLTEQYAFLCECERCGGEGKGDVLHSGEDFLRAGGFPRVDVLMDGDDSVEPPEDVFDDWLAKQLKDDVFCRYQK
ncbi:SET and MYND domain-containing protein 3 [Quaeritorhiza haematococci]|nr:SET and MYND domain-containing protein 3 [Quaeritorhiza haematococci]